MGQAIPRKEVFARAVFELRSRSNAPTPIIHTQLALLHRLTFFGFRKGYKRSDTGSRIGVSIAYMHPYKRKQLTVFRAVQFGTRASSSRMESALGECQRWGVVSGLHWASARWVLWLCSQCYSEPRASEQKSVWKKNRAGSYFTDLTDESVRNR